VKSDFAFGAPKIAIMTFLTPSPISGAAISGRDVVANKVTHEQNRRSAEASARVGAEMARRNAALFLSNNDHLTSVNQSTTHSLDWVSSIAPACMQPSIFSRKRTLRPNSFG